MAANLEKINSLMSEITPLIGSIDRVCFASLREKNRDLVAYGPFAGMQIVDEFCWGDACLKLLGLYEHYLHIAIQEILGENVDGVINVGCAEGYYAIGFARAFANAKIHAFDISEAAQLICAKMAIINDVADRVKVGGELTVKGFQQTLELYDAPFVFMDVEGAESVLLRISEVPALRKARIICECHEWMLPEGLNAFAEQFIDTHVLEIIEEVDLRGTDISDISHLPAQIRLALICEKRGVRMRWIYLTPREITAVKLKP